MRLTARYEGEMIGNDEYHSFHGNGKKPLNNQI